MLDVVNLMINELQYHLAYVGGTSSLNNTTFSEIVKYLPLLSTIFYIMW